MMSSKNLISLLVTSFLLLGCAGSKSVPKPTAEIREYQTRMYDGKISQEVFHAVVNALQDDGFVIDQADINSGFIKANIGDTSINGLEVSQKAVLAYFTMGISLLFTDGNISNVEDLSATITISELKDRTKLRTSFVFKQLNTDGEIVKHEQITDQKVYQSFYTSVEKSIFFDENLLEPTQQTVSR